jgi:hypothetical protein
MRDFASSLKQMMAADFEGVTFEGFTKEEFLQIWGPTLANDILIPFCRLCYQETGNPLYVWEAINLCTEHKSEQPEWIIEYLNMASQNLLEIAKEGKDKGTSETIRDALNLNSGPGPDFFTNYVTTETHIKVYLLAPKIKKKIKAGEIEKLRGESINEIIGKKLGVGADSVKKIRDNEMLKNIFG